MIFASQSPKGNFTFDKAIPGNPRVSITEHARVIRVKMVPLIERELNATVIISRPQRTIHLRTIFCGATRIPCEIIVKKWRRGGEENQRCGVIVLAPIETVAR